MLQIPVLLSVALLIFTVVLRWSLKNDETKKEEIEVLVSRQAPAMADFDVFKEEREFSGFSTKMMMNSPRYECAVCSSFTSTRCSRCKTVRYCSSKCQIIHWRQGHKYDCHPQSPGAFERDNLNENEEMMGQCATNDTCSAEDLSRVDEKFTSGQLNHDVLDSPMPRLSAVTIESSDIYSERREIGTPFSNISVLNMDQKEDKNKTLDMNISMGLASTRLMSPVKKLNREKSRQNDRRKSRSSNPGLSPKCTTDNSCDKAVSSNIHSFKSKEIPCVDNEVLKHSQTIKNDKVKPLASKNSGNSLLQSRSSSSSSQLPHNGIKSSLQKVVHHLKASHQKKPPLCNSSLGISRNPDSKTVFQYDAFVSLYASNAVELKPFGLTNCGNSCYANAVLQCLAYTRPLTIYLLQGTHSKQCWKDEWCFICEFEHLMLKGREGYSPLSPIRILSNISHLGHGREEDAHEFLRYAVDTMQSVCVELSGFSGPLGEESTLVGMTFGGYLYSKIKCMKCHNVSEKYEKMKDLSVEIDGDVRTLQQALKKFTASEMLQGNNKYYCSRCKSYEKAKKKLTVSQAPNILTIVLKRFQAGNFTKLKKAVQFPEFLNMSPYMSDSTDKYSQYSLYAVVVHLDVSRADFSGHYVCYVKNYCEEWFKIDDSAVSSVDLKRVLSEEAYMLLYARDTPRSLASRREFFDGMIFESGYGEKDVLSKVGHKRSDVSVDPWVMQHQSSRNGYAKDPSSYVEEWVTHSVESIPRVDSSSEVSSLFSCSEEGTCSTPSTKDSASADEYSDYLFGRGSVFGR
ncbi:ubiquitin carboxyl-terminal hydrolase 17-like isoform X1 [Chenopodium quinoa]|uniref:ubiquitin carboxyl-terminal hydrolase 17-like isoform X1 n=1 Tax=Chenopodium quinoa TaxID=63459 RepID=UPI000B789689|nr:ubiquitin carboxyl-terminal hydrolase 17-like isoform X1 [Chenopodium quinoa]